MRTRPLLHLSAFAISCILVFAAKIGDINIQPLLGDMDARWLKAGTPYFPGMNELQKHEVFSPRWSKTKKIVFLGASAVDAIGCDYTWHAKNEPHRNVHYKCSVTAQLNELLQKENFSDWRAFDLASNGAKLTNMIYVYTRIRHLKPDIVVYGDTFNYYMWENAGANTISAPQVAYLDKTLTSHPETADLWQRYREHLEKNGWTPPQPVTPPNEIALDAPYGKITLNEFLMQGFSFFRNAYAEEGPPYQIRYSQTHRNWEGDTKPPRHAFNNPDPDLGYFQGVRLITELQRIQGGKSFVYFSPFYGYRYDPSFQEGLETVFGGYLASHGVPHASYVGMDLKPVYETYDGSHQTIYGNRKIAAAILHSLKSQNLLQ